MEVKCPQCASRFNLPDDLIRNGARLRCSICKNIFAMPERGAKDAAPEQGSNSLAGLRSLGTDSTVHSGRRGKLMTALAVLLLCALGIGAYWYYGLRDLPPAESASAESLAKKVELLTMRNVRQYIVENEKVGKVFVIEGRVVNEFPQPKALIAVQAAIYDRDRKVLSEKKQWAGTQLSLFQLQVLSQKELESFLGNKVEILTNNTNVKQGGEVPFMVLFYDPPASVAEFGVKIVDVQDATVQE